MDYYQIDRISQSKLKQLLYGYEDRNDSVFALGTLVDIMVTDREKLENVVISDASAPTEKKLAFCSYLIDNYDELRLDEIANEAYAFADYKTKKPSDYLNDFLKDTWVLLKLEQKKNPNLIVVDKSTYDKAQEMASRVFMSSIWRDLNSEQLAFQEEIMFTITLQTTVSDLTTDTFPHEFKCKCKYDIRNAVTPIDLKTTSKSIKQFPTEAIKYRYDLQSLFYSIAHQAIKTGQPFMVKNMEMMPFLVVSTRNNDPVQLFNFSGPNNYLKAKKDIIRGLLAYYIEENQLNNLNMRISDLWQTDQSFMWLDNVISSMGFHNYSEILVHPE